MKLHYHNIIFVLIIKSFETIDVNAGIVSCVIDICRVLHQTACIRSFYQLDPSILEWSAKVNSKKFVLISLNLNCR